MNHTRRLFLNRLSVIAGVAALNKPVASIVSVIKSVNTLNSSKDAVTIYHTNDLNGHMGTVYENFGGLLQIKTLLKNQEVSGLLLDAGNFMKESNSVAQNRKVISVMNSIGYHAAAIGENEVIMGVDHLMALAPDMKFSLVNCNLQFDNKLSSLVKPYIIINRGKFKIGITAVCNPVKGIRYNDAMECANRMARLLKEDKNCDLVICLSHLGQKQNSNLSDNQKLAEQSENIDMVIGGNMPRLNFNSLILRNKLKHEIILAQTGSNGLLLGKTTIGFDREKEKSGIQSKHFIPGMQENQSYANSLSAIQLAYTQQA